VLFDTDVLIWLFRGNSRSAEVVEAELERQISIVSYMELIQGAKNRQEARTIRGFLKEYGFELLALTENIGHRAAIYIDEYSLVSGLRMADALVAATASENRTALCTGDYGHYRALKDIEIIRFRPAQS
jgi:predicted nucleic acid-binding protein